MGDFSGVRREWVELNNRTDELIGPSGWDLTRLNNKEG